MYVCVFLGGFVCFYLSVSKREEEHGVGAVGKSQEESGEEKCVVTTLA